MPDVDASVLGWPDRLRAVQRARRELPVTPVPLDALARMAARMLATPMAVVTLVGAEQEEFLGLFGLPEPFASARRGSLRYSVCVYVVSAGAAVAVADTLIDPEMREHPAVRQWGVRAFAGVPLRDGEGRPLGAVTVLDTRPRAWSPPELALLAHLAEMLGAIPSGDDSAAAAMATLRQGTGDPATAEPERVGVSARAQVQQAFITALLDSLQVGVVAVDLDGRLVLVNTMMRELFGLRGDASEDEARAAALSRLRHLDGTPMTVREIAVTRALHGETVRDAEVAIHHPGEPDRYLLTNGQPIRDADGHRMGAVAAALDITARRRGERFRDCELRVAHILTGSATLAQAAPAVVEAVGTALRWEHVALWFIDEVADLARRAAQWDTPGSAIAALVPESIGRDDEPVLVGRAWATGQPVWVPDLTGIATRDPRLRELAAVATELGVRTATAVPVLDGVTTVAVLTGLTSAGERDAFLVTGLLQGIAHQLGQAMARDHAAELDRRLAQAKDDFLTLIGHELRTPLTSVITYSGLLAEDAAELDDDTRQMLAVVVRNAGAVQRIIDDLLDLAGVESGHLTLHRQPTDLAAVVTEAVAAARHGDDIRVHTDVPASLVVDADPARIRQIVDHLLSNAIKYSPHGGDVHVRVSSPDRGVAELTVTDAGIGIPAADRDRLFTRFHRAGNARHTAIAGAGLGLALVRTLVEAHGGTTVHDPTQRPGTRIVVRLPTGAPPAGS